MEKEISLYVHIPFCKQKCYYCDFSSFPGRETLMDEYVEALNKEILLKAKGYIIKTVFIGGGTPSYLNLEAMKKLLTAINMLSLKKDLEFTMECNPGTLEEDKLLLMKNMGVNRISMGVQSTHNHLLKSIGRIHSFEEFKENFIKAREVGFENINVDLMFGLPNQRVEEWEKSLEEIGELGPEHISAYSLIIEEGTVLYKMYERDEVHLPNEDEEREMYHNTCNVLKKYGYNQYEISNFCKKNKECKHNITYWNLEEYIGVGSCSSSYLEGVRYKNCDSIEEYIGNINSKGSANEETHKNTIEDEMGEFVFMNLRKSEGFSKKAFDQRFGKDIYYIYGEVLKKHKNNELIIDDGERIFLSAKGIEVSNYVMCDFV